MSDLFDKALHYLGQNKENNEVFFLNIGSMDGIMFDEMHGYVTMYDFRGLYVEPIPYLFDKLKANIKKGNLFENCAISDYDGEIEMIMIDENAIDSGIVHNCFYGMSAVFPPKNGLGSEGDKLIVEKYGKLIKVPCMTLNSLIKKYDLKRIDIIKMDAEGHDYKIFKQIDFEKFKPKIVRLEWINLTIDEQSCVIDTLKKYNYDYEISTQDITAITNDLANIINSGYQTVISSNNAKTEISIIDSAPKITLVTGLWDIGRSNLTESWSRRFQDYLDNFEKLLQIDVNIIIFGDESLEKFVFSRKNRDQRNTHFVVRDLDWFKHNEYYDKIQKIRTDPKWYEQVGWLKDSTQAKLEMYNPLVMSKMFLLNDAQILDKFNSDYMFWIDAGITFTVNPGYFTHDMVLPKLPEYSTKFTFIAFPYETTTEIHGFNYDRMCYYALDDVKLVARGGFFGGPKKVISQVNSIYYALLMDTLSNNLMGTEESIFSIILYRYPELINYVKINSDGLLYTFFEDLKNNNVKICSNLQKKYAVINPDIELTKSFQNIKTHLYVLTYNFPDQFEALIKSFENSDALFLTKPKKFLLNNSTDATTNDKYDYLCEKYGFEQIKQNNIGICGGRQFIAEHFANSDADYYIFFEDDMMLYEKGNNESCHNGFRKWIPDLYNKSLWITHKEKYDYLKLNFTEIYGSNETQWAWYNVPDEVRFKYFPDKRRKPEFGIDPNAPLTLFTNIKKHENLLYIEGDIYYCNWPMWISKEGNRKIFLNPKFAHPYEQTWMSSVFQKQKNGEFKAALLLLSPINHNRLFYYKGTERREN